MNWLASFAGFVLISVFFLITPQGDDMTNYQWVLYIVGLFLIGYLWIEASTDK